MKSFSILKFRLLTMVRWIRVFNLATVTQISSNGFLPCKKKILKAAKIRKTSMGFKSWTVEKMEFVVRMAQVFTNLISTVSKINILLRVAKRKFRKDDHSISSYKTKLMIAHLLLLKQSFLERSVFSIFLVEILSHVREKLICSILLMKRTRTVLIYMAPLLNG